MERLHIGDIVKIIEKNQIGAIGTISKYNNESVDNCIYAIVYEDLELEQEVDKEHDEYLDFGCEDISGESAWFNRQELELLQVNPFNKKS